MLGWCQLLHRTSVIVMSSAQDLLRASQTFFDAFAANKSSISLMENFSTSKPIIIQHASSSCPYPRASRLIGANAVRSYFDLLSTHFVRSKMELHGLPIVDAGEKQVKMVASVTWTWRRSKRSWVEEFTWTLDYDEQLKIICFIVETTSPRGTCVMKAVDDEQFTVPPVKGRVSALPMLLENSKCKCLVTQN